MPIDFPYMLKPSDFKNHNDYKIIRQLAIEKARRSPHGVGTWGMELDKSINKRFPNKAKQVLAVEARELADERIRTKAEIVDIIWESG